MARELPRVEAAISQLAVADLGANWHASAIKRPIPALRTALAKLMFSIRFSSRREALLRDAGLLLLRLWFGLVLALGHGLVKVMDFEAFQSSVARHGFVLPTLSALFAALSELVGGLLLALGLVTRPAAACVVVTMLSAGLHVHAADPFRKKEFALAYAVAALVLLLTGPGRFSVDRIWARGRGK